MKRLVPYFEAYNDPDGAAKLAARRYVVFNLGTDDAGPFQVVEYDDPPSPREELLMGLALYDRYRKQKGRP